MLKLHEFSAIRDLAMCTYDIFQNCVGCTNDSSIFLMSVVLFAGSFGISFALKNFRTTGYFPGSIRNFLSNFAVIIGIFVMTALDYMAGIQTPKLDVPDSIKPTWEGRDWLVTHALIFADHLLTNPWYKNDPL